MFKVIQLNHFVLAVIIFIITTTTCVAHEPWLLTPEQLQIFKSVPSPLIFKQITVFNTSIMVAATITIVAWIIFNIKYPEDIHSYTSHKPWLALLSLRIGVGTTLILLSLGMIPRTGVDYLSHPTLLAPEFLLDRNAIFQITVLYIQLILGIFLLLGLFTRVSALLLVVLLIVGEYLYGIDLWQYAGFYLAIALVLFKQMGGKYSIDYLIMGKQKSTLRWQDSLLIAQLLVGITFIYSAISIKFFYPNIDIGILGMRHAFSFGVPYDDFTFMMLVIEVTIGLAIIIGYRLYVVATFLLGLFIFLSIDLSENLLAHSFIYGILMMFILLKGHPVASKR